MIDIPSLLIKCFSFNVENGILYYFLKNLYLLEKHTEIFTDKLLWCLGFSKSKRRVKWMGVERKQGRWCVCWSWWWGHGSSLYNCFCFVCVWNFPWEMFFKNVWIFRKKTRLDFSRYVPSFRNQSHLKSLSLNLN